MALKTVFSRVLVAGAFVSVVALVAVPGVSQAKPKASTPTPATYYLSLGDSYSVGYQPVPLPHGGATAGYTAVVAKKENMTLENFGCGGATTSSILNVMGPCGSNGFAPPAAFNKAPVSATQTQLTAAQAFITANPGHVGLITVSIGGNDVTPCVNASPTNPVNGETNPILCVGAGVSAIQTNVITLVNALKGSLSASGDPTTPIVGLTYPDVILGAWVYPTFPATSATKSLATESVGAFQQFINKDLAAAYTSYSHGKFVDVTKATGAYTPLTKLKNLKPYGKIPAAVAEVCKYTYYCSMGNIHANNKGYKLEGKLIVAALAK